MGPEGHQGHICSERESLRSTAEESRSSGRRPTGGHLTRHRAGHVALFFLIKGERDTTNLPKVRVSDHLLF
jgi:hypothetical protein